jgi:hypothetical protein
MYLGNTGSDLGRIANVPQLEKQQAMQGQIFKWIFWCARSRISHIK